MKRRLIILVVLIVALSMMLSSCSPSSNVYLSQGEGWYMGFGSQIIDIPKNDEPLYIAGYKNGREIEGVLDHPCANAVWADTGDGGVLLVGIDSVGVSNKTVENIRDELSGFCRETGCVSVNVYATHTHAGIDTMGLWGPVAVDGKNTDYMTNLVNAAAAAAREAYEDRTEGALYFGSAETEGLLYDSRRPIEFDRAVCQLRFEPVDTSEDGIRLISYSAHAESLRGDNTMLSRDFPGALADIIKEKSGDDVMYLPGAIGGLIMTRELVSPFDAEENMRLTAQLLSEEVLSIDDETALTANLAVSNMKIKLPLDNTYFFFGKFLGILDNQTERGKSETGYVIKSELGVLTLGEVTIALIPGEIFPELVSGEGLSEGDPEPLVEIAQRHGVQKLLTLGLCNDEIGYIIPPGNFLLNEEVPYIETVEDVFGEDHYEETNSMGKNTARIIAEAFEQSLMVQNEKTKE